MFTGVRGFDPVPHDRLVPGFQTPARSLSARSPAKEGRLRVQGLQRALVPGELSAGMLEGSPTVDERNPAPLLKQWETISFMEVTGESYFQGILGGGGFRPPTVCPVISEELP